MSEMYELRQRTRALKYQTDVPCCLPLYRTPRGSLILAREELPGCFPDPRYAYNVLYEQHQEDASNQRGHSCITFLFMTEIERCANDHALLGQCIKGISCISFSSHPFSLLAEEDYLGRERLVRSQASMKNKLHKKRKAELDGDCPNSL